MEGSSQKALFLFLTFFKGMMFAFTGGSAALPIVERAIVDKKKWLTREEFWTYPVLGQSLPGVISIHNSILIGNRIAGPFGAFMAVLGTVTPAFVFMLIIAAFFQTFVDNPYIQRAIRGIRVVTVVILLGSAIRVLDTVPRQLFSLILVLIAIFVPLLFGFSAFWTVFCCGAAGVLSVLIDPSVLRQPSKSGSEGEE